MLVRFIGLDTNTLPPVYCDYKTLLDIQFQLSYNATFNHTQGNQWDGTCPSDPTFTRQGNQWDGTCPSDPTITQSANICHYTSHSRQTSAITQSHQLGRMREQQDKHPPNWKPHNIG